MLFTPYGLRIEDIIKLIQYVYSDANISEILRALIIFYIVYKEDVLLNSETFLFFIEYCGLFVREKLKYYASAAVVYTLNVVYTIFGSHHHPVSAPSTVGMHHGLMGHTTDNSARHEWWWCGPRLVVYTMASQRMKTTDGGLRRSIRNWSEGYPELKRMKLRNWMFIPTLKKGTNKWNGSQDWTFDSCRACN